MAASEKLLGAHLPAHLLIPEKTGANKQVRFVTAEDGSRNGLCHFIKIAQEEEEDVLTFTCHVIGALQQTVIGHILWILSIIFAVAGITIGILRFSSCPCERTIPLFVSVGGTILLLKGLLRGLQKCSGRKPINERQSLYTVNDILTTLLVFWTMTGAVWVLGSLSKVQTDSPDLPEYCDVLLYWSAFAMVCIFIGGIVAWTALAISLCVFYSYHDDPPPFYSCFNDVPVENPLKSAKPTVFILESGNA